MFASPFIESSCTLRPKVAAAFVDVEAFARAAIAETNLNYSNSQVNIHTELAHTYMLDYQESGNHKNNVTKFRKNQDSFMNEVHELRNNYKADVCVLLIDDNKGCGWADQIFATEDRAFAVVHYTYATGNYSFGHEIGHLQGSRHNIEADRDTTPFRYVRGYYHFGL